MSMIDTLNMLSTSDLICLAGLVFCFVIQMLFYWIVFAKPYRYVKKLKSGRIDVSSGQPPVSVIVLVKNEFYDLNDFLPSILEQNYPHFEVIIVNDGHSDENELALTVLQNKYANLYATRIPDGTRSISRKKLALSLGIKASKHELLLFTEADSCPKSPEWISLMLRHIRDSKSIVLGLSVKEKKKGFLSSFIAFDYLFSNLKFLTLALFNRPYAGDGHNLLYTKDHFEREKGYCKYHFLAPGEDDLFINTIANKHNTSVELSPDSVVETKIEGIYDYRQRKIDREAASYFMKKGPVCFWRIESYTRVAFYLFLIFCFVEKELVSLLPIAAAAVFILRLLSQIVVWFKIHKSLKLGRLPFFLPFYDFFQPFMNVSVFLYRVFKLKNSFVSKL